MDSVANQQYVEIPANIKKVTGVKVTTGTTEWTPREVPNRDFWNRLNYTTATAYTADYPNWWYSFNGRVYLHPTSSIIRTVTISGRIGFSRLNIADYTTGAVTTATLGGASIVGTTSTVWTRPMEGRFLRITASNSPNKGDDEWYEIASVVSGTAITLKKSYLGVSIVVGTAAYVIGQMSPLPDGYQEAPIYWATHVYYLTKKLPGAEEKAVLFKGMHDELVQQLVSDYGSETENVLVEDEPVDDQINPNLVVRL